MSDWIPSQAGLRTHPKTKRAARALQVPPEHLIGQLHCLWWWALEYAPDGDVEDFEAEDLADAAGWTGDAETFVTTLTMCGSKGGAGFLERLNGRLTIHDWEENQGDRFRARIQAAAKKRAQRAAKQGHEAEDVPNVGDTVPVHRDLARANDRPTDQTDKTDKSPAREPQKPVENPSPVDNLVEWARRNIPDWKERGDDSVLFETALKTFPASQIQAVMSNLAIHQAANHEYKELRSTLSKWLKRETPQKLPPYIGKPVEQLIRPSPEQLKASANELHAATACFRGIP